MMKPQKYRVNHDLKMEQLGNKHILTSEQLKDVLLLNEMSGYILSLIKDGKTYDEILARIILEFDVDEQVLQCDLDKFLADAVKESIMIQLE